MTGIAILLTLLAFSILALFILGCSNADLGERLRKANARAEFVRDQRDNLADACEALTEDLTEADLLATKQARRSLEQKERIAQIEARELPQLDEIRARRAGATGSVWGPS